MSITLDEFIESVTSSGLMDSEKIQSFLDTLPMEHRPTTAEDLAKELYRAGKLTKFQAQAIYQKKTRGLVVGNYVVLDKLGKGGMGAVYKAQHKRMKRMVALKMLPSSATKSADSVKRFQREVEAAAKLSHPNIVTAYDADEEKGVHFLVMEYVEGQDLYALVKEHGTLSVARAVDYVVQAAKGLEYAHSQGVIHRDIKPHNLLLDKNGTVKILDMGLARIEEAVAGTDAAADEGLTQSGQVMGTLDYMPPEQALDTRTVDARADTYSLGCTLHYLLIGRPPYPGDTVGKKMLAHRMEPIPSLRQLRSDVPQSLDAVFHKMMAKDPKDRQQTMTEVISELQGCTQHTGLAAPPSFPPSSGSYAETVDIKREDTAPPAESLSPLDELFASEPVQITERLIAPSLRARKRWTKQQKTMIAVIAGGVAVLLLVLGVILRMRTSEGTLVVEIDQPDATVQVLNEKGKVLIEQKAQKGTLTIGVDPGKRRLRVQKEGFEVFAKELTIATGGKETIKAKLEPVAAAQPKDIEREVAKWVLERQGKLTVSVDGQGREVRVIAELPMETFKVTGVDLSGNASVGDEVFEHLQGLTALGSLNLDGTKVTGKGIERLQSAKAIGLVSLSRTQLTDAGMANLKELANLKCVLVNDTQVSDAGLEQIQGLSLGLLDAGWTRVTYEGFAKFKGLAFGTIGNFSHPVTDASFENFAGMTRLCGLRIAASGVTDNGLKPLARLASLKGLTLVGAFTDRSLEPLKALNTLEELHLEGAGNVTAAEVAALQTALPNCKITWVRPAGQSMGAATESAKSPVTPAGTTPHPAIAPFDAAKAKQHQDAWAKHLGVPVEITNSIGMKLVLIPPGEFMMGEGDGAHNVRITKPFYLGRYEVTQGQYETIAGVNPSVFAATLIDASAFTPPLSESETRFRHRFIKNVAPGQDPNCRPVDTVSWFDATEFCRLLSTRSDEQLARRTYRLPTEAEWEYACRAGTATRWSCGDDEGILLESAWLAKNSDNMSHPVGEKHPNAWRLCDMHGNAWEWCGNWTGPDAYAQFLAGKPVSPPADSRCVMRGGSWTKGPSECRSSQFLEYEHARRNPDFGFRVAVPVPEGGSVRVETGKESGAARLGKGGQYSPPTKDGPAPPPAIAPFSADKAKQHQEAWAKHLGVPVEHTNTLGMKLILIPPGEFTMGSAKEFIKAEQSRGGDNWLMERLAGEGPQHQVRITLPFWIGATEVTQAEYRQVVGSDPSDWKGDSQRPVEHVSWEEATEFCRRLSELTDEKARKRHYQLPTEAQWEYACRAGTSDAQFFNPPLGPPSAELSDRLLAEYGWFAANSGGQPRPVGQKLVNPWGLYDVYGNVWEWCQDRYDPSYYTKSPRDDPPGPSEGSHRVLRGGGFDMDAGQCRSANRLHFQPSFHAVLGFRVSLVLADK